MQSREVRDRLVEALELDLVGPGEGSPLEQETLPQSPSRWYLTGFLVPLEAPLEQKVDPNVDEEVDEVRRTGGGDDGGPPENAAARRAFFPSSMGLSFLLPSGGREFRAIVRWGEYQALADIPAGEGALDPGFRRDDEGERVRMYCETAKVESGEDEEERVRGWRRHQRREELRLSIPAESARPVEHPVPGSGGLAVVVSSRGVRLSGVAADHIPAGTRSVSVFVVNRRRPSGKRKSEAFVYQTELECACEGGFFPRPNLRGLESSDWDDAVADLQYHNACEYAVGHGVATRSETVDGICRSVRTRWIPQAQVERVAPAPIAGVELGLEALAGLADGVEARQKLLPLVEEYRKWIGAQKSAFSGLKGKRPATAAELFKRAEIAAKRILAGISLLSDPTSLEAFRIANRAMAVQYRRRESILQQKDPSAMPTPVWRPFQLAFILMNLPGIADPGHDDRGIVDLLFFPTGGGKTEAYLGLAAFTLVLRRLRDPGVGSSGVSVLMRYTLRLLTLDQLGRAATLICALELEREEAPKKLGTWPFEIGLWVGQAATPNRMGRRGDNNPYSARAKTVAFQNNGSKPSPIPLEECPWCGWKFKNSSFRLMPNRDEPTDLFIGCVNPRCDFTRDRRLPILGVDEQIYRRLPGFIIATVDKFASLPWTGQTGAFFGAVERYNDNGFYGPCDPGRGQALAGPLPPPDLIIQDELHLISGPLGTMVGLYEAAIDALCLREIAGKTVRPKIVASTATVRRADDQIRALFARDAAEIFPPPGPDRRDSFFARTHTATESNPRLYLGIAAQGRSPKVLLLRTYLALLGAGQKAFLADGGPRNKANAADPYLTLVGYFNSLRELGGSRRIVEDEVTSRLSGYAKRRRTGEKDGLFANRSIASDLVELTSRVGTNKVAEAKRRLARLFHEGDHVDVAIATNMISVGLDISRLGLMVVFGQPKTTAEYIQATSRVGRDPERPGLVVTLFNLHRPRDRSHYERLAAYHESFYRGVEAASVTPFSARALDRGLAGAVVALARQGHPAFTAPKGAGEILAALGALDDVVATLGDRAGAHKRFRNARERDALRQQVRALVKDLLNAWFRIAKENQDKGIALQYNNRESGGNVTALLHDFLSQDLKRLPKVYERFRANLSLRDVESTVQLHMKTLDGRVVEVEDE